MSLQHAAKHLSAHGRGPDTTLVHMSKGEVKSLNDLAMAHGGHLTTNPHTGLPEAGFLSRLLPMIAGAGLMMVPGMQPLAASAIVGGGYAAATGSLKKGLMAGLGAYGGAGLANSLATAGASSVTPEAVAPTAEVAPAATSAPSPLRGEFATTPQATAGVQSGSPLGGTGYAPPASAFPTPTAPAVEVTPIQTATAQPTPATWGQGPMATPNYSAYTAPAAPTAAPTPAPAPTTVTSAPVTQGPGSGFNIPSAQAGASPTSSLSPENMTTSQRLEAMKNGLSFDNLSNWASNNKMQAYGLGASVLMPWDQDQKQRTPYHDSDPGQQYTYEANATNPTPTASPTGQEQKYFNQRYVPRAADGGMMATGGISDDQYNLGSYSDGGRLLRGPGDGVSDSIPATIGHKQPARLADGEFVVPARIVSELGNGSTEAGARKLYAMMDRIQKTRGSTVGKGKMAKNSRADRYLPA